MFINGLGNNGPYFAPDDGFTGGASSIGPSDTSQKKLFKERTVAKAGTFLNRTFQAAGF
jgi:hypothetical protein